MAFFLGLMITAIALGTAYLFAVKPWWFPAFISEYGRAYDHQFMLTLAITGALFVAAQLLLGYFVVRYRRRDGAKAGYLPGAGRAALIGTALVALLLFAIDLGMELTDAKLWARVQMEKAPAGSLQVEVTGQQFAWNFRYPGPDGRFGRTKVDLVNDAVGNPLGLDPDDAASRDDVVMPVLVVPVDRPIELILRSKDVIHSFFVRELRMKQDAVPGMETHVRFTADRIGRYEIPCAELCGLGHYQMRSFLLVMARPDFERWLRDNAPPGQ